MSEAGYIISQMTAVILVLMLFAGLVKGAMGLRWERAQYWQLDRFKLSAWELLTDVDDLRQEDEPGNCWDRLMARCSRRDFILVGPVAYRRDVLFLVNVLIFFLLPISFLMSLLRLPFSTCCDACERFWPPPYDDFYHGGAPTQPCPPSNGLSSSMEAVPTTSLSSTATASRSRAVETPADSTAQAVVSRSRSGREEETSERETAATSSREVPDRVDATTLTPSFERTTPLISTSPIAITTTAAVSTSTGMEAASSPSMLQSLSSTCLGTVFMSPSAQFLDAGRTTQGTASSKSTAAKGHPAAKDKPPSSQDSDPEPPLPPAPSMNAHRLHPRSPLLWSRSSLGRPRPQHRPRVRHSSRYHRGCVPHRTAVADSGDRRASGRPRADCPVCKLYSEDG